MKAIAELKQGLSEGWKSVAEGWSQMRERASSALTRFRGPARATAGGTEAAMEDAFVLGCAGWGLLAGEVFEDRDRVVVRLEAPGMDTKDLDLQLAGDLLWVRGEKRYARESGDGRYRLRECAYGSFERALRMPCPVRADQARASYRRGVLRIELPKERSATPRRVTVKVR